MKKIFSIFLSVMIITSSAFSAENISCNLESVVDFAPVGDTAGGVVLSKREVVRDCNVTTTVVGKCIKWKENNQFSSLPMEAYNGFDTRDYSDTIGQFFASAGAYDQMEHLWSGFRGHCVTGTLQDFDWASDPMFWAGLVLDYLMAGGEAGAVSDGVNSAAQSTGSTIVSEEATKQAAEQAASAAAKEAGTEVTSAAAQEAGKQAAEQLVTNAGMCAISGGINLGMAAADYASAGSGTDPEFCNNIDEICGEDNEDTQSDVMTMDKVAFDDLVDSYEEEGDNLYDFVEVLDDGMSTGIVTYRFKRMDEIDNIDQMNNEEIEKMKKKMKETQAEVEIASAAAGLASCMVTDSSGSVNTEAKRSDGGDDSKIVSAESLENMAVSVISHMIPPPAGPIIGAVLKIIVAFANSFESVDSCYDEDDAQAQGSRHEKTQKALKYNLCRPLYDKCEDEWVWGGCCLTGFEYCCYDQLLTKILVEQIKAELGRDWSNCTGISLRDLNYISFRQCRDNELNDGIDGAHKYGENWDPTEAFQYKHKCMDLTEFKDYLSDTLGEDIDKSTFDDYWNDLMDDSPI